MWIIRGLPNQTFSAGSTRPLLGMGFLPAVRPASLHGVRPALCCCSPSASLLRSNYLRRMPLFRGEGAPAAAAPSCLTCRSRCRSSTAADATLAPPGHTG